MPICSSGLLGSKDSFDIVIDTLRVFNIDVYSLVNLAASISFVAPYIEVKFGVSPKTLCEPFSFSAVVGDPVILSMDWLHCCYAPEDCRPIIVHFQFLD